MQQKGRHKKIRYIQKMPKAAQFSPRGNPGRPDETELRIDHFESIKLADHQGYSQTEGAQAMGISRPSFGRILREARKIIADALANGKTIHIRTGDVQVGVRQKNLPKKNELAQDIQNTQLQLREEALRKNIIKYRKSSKESADPHNPLRINP